MFFKDSSINLANTQVDLINDPCKFVRGKVEEVFNPTAKDFVERIAKRGVPVLIHGANVGRAPTLWDAKYLMRHHPDKIVSVHVCPDSRMDFVCKNFIYKTMSFKEMIQRTSGMFQHTFQQQTQNDQGKHMYVYQISNIKYQNHTRLT